MLVEQPITAFLDELASSASTPGGGGAAALSAAMGAGLVAMTMNLTVGRPAYAEHEAELQRILAEAERLRKAATDLIDDDAVAFGGVSAAYKLPRGTDDEKHARTAAIQQALKDASAPPLKLAEIARAVIDLCPNAVRFGNPNLISDAAGGAHLALGGLEGGRLNVEINLKLIKDEAFVTATRKRLDAALAGARATVDETDTIMRSR